MDEMIRLVVIFEELLDKYKEYEQKSIDQFHGYNSIKYGAKIEAFQQVVFMMRASIEKRQQSD